MHFTTTHGPPGRAAPSALLPRGPLFFRHASSVVPGSCPGRLFPHLRMLHRGSRTVKGRARLGHGATSRRRPRPPAVARARPSRLRSRPRLLAALLLLLRSAHQAHAAPPDIPPVWRPAGAVWVQYGGGFYWRMTEGSGALLECDRHLDARSHAPGRIFKMCHALP
ncbi:hypothetical protein NDU88_003577 [Pleurodeles waltl]|uniref:Uncharacterized protein n=1 Tax=Pleurodeles waltl TaxID=8319 RepID=A0AAV7LIW4_PLEWA|nr:hypothetical protein NDU88_003577 [Pleurodeles waltl]